MPGSPGFRSCMWTVSGEYTGAAGISAYKSEFDQPSATFVPVELEGGGGNGKWALE